WSVMYRWEEEEEGPRRSRSRFFAMADPHGALVYLDGEGSGAERASHHGARCAHVRGEQPDRGQPATRPRLTYEPASAAFARPGLDPPALWRSWLVHAWASAGCRPRMRLLPRARAEPCAPARGSVASRGPDRRGARD